MKSAILLLLPFFFFYTAAAQNIRQHTGYRFSKEDINEFLVFKSQKEKKKGVISLVAGAVFTGIGLYMANNSPDVVRTGSSSYFPASIGRAIGGVGMVTSLVSIPFFSNARKLKNEAANILAGQPSTFSTTRTTSGNMRIW